MSNKLLAFGALVAFGWAFTSALPDPPLAVADAMPARPTSAVPSSAGAGHNSFEVHQAPVPLVRIARPSATVPASPGAPSLGEEAKLADRLDSRAAKTAIEADGYKGVSVVGRGANGTWRATAYRGATEVQLVVDGTGRVAAE